MRAGSVLLRLALFLLVTQIAGGGKKSGKNTVGKSRSRRGEQLQTMFTSAVAKNGHGADSPDITRILRLVLAFRSICNRQYQEESLARRKELEARQVETMVRDNDDMVQENADMRAREALAKEHGEETKLRQLKRWLEKNAFDGRPREVFVQAKGKERFWKIMTGLRQLRRQGPVDRDAEKEREEEEKHEAFLGEMRVWMDERWADKVDEVLGKEPRYLEGFPVRDTLSRPILPQEWKRKGPAAYRRINQCLQCSVKGLRCSRSQSQGDDWTFGSRRRLGACFRCLHHDEKHECLVPSRIVIPDGEDEDGDEDKMTVVEWKLAHPRAELLPVKENAQAWREERDAIKRRWMEEREGAVLDVFGSRTAFVTKSAFAPPMTDVAAEFEETRKRRRRKKTIKDHGKCKSFRSSKMKRSNSQCQPPTPHRHFTTRRYLPNHQ